MCEQQETHLHIPTYPHPVFLALSQTGHPTAEFCCRAGRSGQVLACRNRRPRQRPGLGQLPAAAVAAAGDALARSLLTRTLKHEMPEAVWTQNMEAFWRHLRTWNMSLQDCELWRRYWKIAKNCTCTSTPHCMLLALPSVSQKRACAVPATPQTAPQTARPPIPPKCARSVTSKQHPKAAPQTACPQHPAHESHKNAPAP